MPKYRQIDTAPDGLVQAHVSDESLVHSALEEVDALLVEVEKHQISKNIHFYVSNPFPLMASGKGRVDTTFSLDDKRIRSLVKLVKQTFKQFDIDNVDEKLSRGNIIVRRYKPGMSIPFHIDHADCDEEVVGIVLKNRDVKNRGIRYQKNDMEYIVEEDMGTTFCMAGRARYDWQHGLPPVSAERISVTCRIFKSDVYASYVKDLEETSIPARIEDTKEVDETICVVLRLNTNKNKTKSITMNSTVVMKELLKVCRNKFQFKPKKIYREFGDVLENGDVLRNGEMLYISKGEGFSGSTIDKAKIAAEEEAKKREEEEKKYEDTPVMNNTIIRDACLYWASQYYASIQFKMNIQDIGELSPPSTNAFMNSTEVGEYLEHKAALTIPEFREFILRVGDTVDDITKYTWFASSHTDTDIRTTSLYIVALEDDAYYWVEIRAEAKPAVKGAEKRDGPLWVLEGGLNNPAAKWKGNKYQLKRGYVSTDLMVLFAGTTWPSTYYTCKIELDGKAYTSAAQYVMATQAELFGDEERYEELMNGSFDPAPHKLFDHKAPKTDVRRVKGFDAKVWGKKGPDIMFKATYEKFKQNPELKHKLLETGDKIIVEATDDPVWGIGMAISHPDATNPKKWRGDNKMGNLLGQIRELLKSSTV